MKRNIIGALCVLALCGCAQFSTTQTDVSYEDGKPSRTVTTKAKAGTLLSSSSALANFKATQTDKTQSATVGSLQQESTTTTNFAVNATALIQLIQALKTP